MQTDEGRREKNKTPRTKEMEKRKRNLGISKSTNSHLPSELEELLTPN